MPASGKRRRGKRAPKSIAPARARTTKKRVRTRARARELFAKRSAAARKGWETRRRKKSIARVHAPDKEWEPEGGWQGEEFDQDEEIEFMTADEVYEHFETLADRLELPISDIYRMSHGYDPLH